MVVLKTFFRTEKGPYSEDPGDHENGSNPVMTDERSAFSSTTTPYPSSPNMMVLRTEGRDQNVQKQHKRFAESRDSLRPRSMASWRSQTTSRRSNRLTGQESRHIDLLDALFTSHRYRIKSANTMSPTTPYNEDIAERNMTRFLRAQPKAALYASFVSALYQEDVASKNIAESHRRSRSLSRPGSRYRSNGHGMNHTPQADSQYGKHSSNGNPDSKGRDGQISRPVSSGSWSRPPVDESAARAREQWRRRSQILRAQISEPNLTAENDPPHTLALSRSTGYLSAFPAHNDKQLNSSRDNSTVPIPPRGIRNINEYPVLSKAISSQNHPMNFNEPPSSTPVLGPGRNVRDLSVNTELASQRRRTSKILHHAIQPPTPGNLDMRQNPSIAEVINSPMPEESPASISAAKVEEIMNMFRKAYEPTQAAEANTFETLQDTIIREVNSHEAFQRVPTPAPGPPFTPPCETFNGSPITQKPSSPGLQRSFSAKEGQFAKLVRGGASRKHRQGLESRKSISTILPRSSDKLFRLAAGSMRRRSHTDAQGSSADFSESDGSKQGSPDDQVTYMDLLMRSANRSTSPAHDSARNLSRPQSTASLPSICYMRAQAFAGGESRTPLSGSENTVDDDSIIHLPNIETPRIQVYGVDRNNVKYFIRNSTPHDAHRLMNWPLRQSPHPSESDDDSAILKQADSFPLPPRSRSSHQLRVSRSLETC